MTAPRRICVITGTRAEYGLLRGLMAELRDAPEVTLQVVATGTHLVEAHGGTVAEIERDGFAVDERVHMLLAADAPVAVAKSMGLALMGVAEALDRLRPDLVVLLGDRYEALAAAEAAMLLGIPIAHLHGGEATEGAVDEAIRHAITKMSHLHFTAAAPFRDRVIQLGEDPARVFEVGAMGLDNVAALDPYPLDALAGELGIALERPVFLATYHPVTLERDAEALVGALLEALEAFPQATVVFTGTNADAHGGRVAAAIARFAAARPDRVALAASLGVRRYLTLMGAADLVLGNSSSGILEAPSMGVPTVNVGARQQGRPRAPSVIDCAEEAGAIRAAIARALDPAFTERARRRETPYGTPGAARRVADVLRAVDLDGILLQRFHAVGSIRAHGDAPKGTA